MAQAVLRSERPASAPDAAALLRSASEEGRTVRFRGGGTKLGWGRLAPEPDLAVSTGGLERLVEHNVGDLTAVAEAGVALARAQEAFAAEGQMLALDPPAIDGSTIGGVIATGDSGPLRHRFGSPRDLIIGIKVALPDGTIAKAGGKVIKNVAGYDLAKLFSGAFGTLGLITEVALRLHPRPAAMATALLRGADPGALAAAAAALSHAPLEQLALDVSWAGGQGAVLSRFGGATAREQAEAALREGRDADGLTREVVDDDEQLWREQCARQRSQGGMVVRVSGLQSRLADILRAAEGHGATMAGRAGSGLCWLALDERESHEALAAVEDLRRELKPLRCVVLDAPEDVRAALDPWGPHDDRALALMRRVKQQFDPQGVCNPGIFVGGM
ncbi:MAG TPA: FAD-binding oxidoreductase [Solirubrobacterales bacterium]|nr:FAD-binding oxidoreductase [Solirubrobacterales bacterium]